MISKQSFNIRNYEPETKINVENPLEKLEDIKKVK